MCVACAGYFRCACWCGCVDVGGLSAFLPMELVPALGDCLCAVCAVVCGGGDGGRCAGRLVWRARTLSSRLPDELTNTQRKRGLRIQVRHALKRAQPRQ